MNAGQLRLEPFSAGDPSRRKSEPPRRKEILFFLESSRLGGSIILGSSPKSTAPPAADTVPEISNAIALGMNVALEDECYC